MEIYWNHFLQYTNLNAGEALWYLCTLTGEARDYCDIHAPDRMDGCDCPPHEIEVFEKGKCILRFEIPRKEVAS